LIALVGAGSVGLTWALVDFIYGGDKSESESLIDKIDDDQKFASITYQNRAKGHHLLL
jgi:hypothetical protein